MQSWKSIFAKVVPFHVFFNNWVHFHAILSIEKIHVLYMISPNAETTKKLLRQSEGSLSGFSDAISTFQQRVLLFHRICSNKSKFFTLAILLLLWIKYKPSITTSSNHKPPFLVLATSRFSPVPSKILLPRIPVLQAFSVKVSLGLPTTTTNPWADSALPAAPCRATPHIRLPLLPHGYVWSMVWLSRRRLPSMSMMSLMSLMSVCPV